MKRIFYSFITIAACFIVSSQVYAKQEANSIILKELEQIEATITSSNDIETIKNQIQDSRNRIEIIVKDKYAKVENTPITKKAIDEIDTFITKLFSLKETAKNKEFKSNKRDKHDANDEIIRNKHILTSSIIILESVLVLIYIKMYTNIFIDGWTGMMQYYNNLINVLKIKQDDNTLKYIDILFEPILLMQKLLELEIKLKSLLYLKNEFKTSCET